MARRSDHTREELRELALTAAARLLAKHGPDGLTTRAVAGRIGYTVGSLYLVFRDREDLLWQINARTLDALYEAMQEAPAGSRSPDMQLAALARTYVQYAFEHEACWRLIFEQSLPAPRPEWWSRQVRRMFALVEAQLKALSDRPGDVQRAAEALWSGVHGVCMLGLTGRLEQNDVAAVQKLAESLVANYLAGLTASRPKTKKTRARRGR